MPFLQDSYDLGGLHLGNVQLCLKTPDYGAKLPGHRTSDVFQHLTESFPAPSDADRVQFDQCLSETSLLISGLLEYQTLSKAVLVGKFSNPCMCISCLNNIVFQDLNKSDNCVCGLLSKGSYFSLEFVCFHHSLV